MIKKIPDELFEQLSIVSPLLSDSLRNEEGLVHKYNENFSSNQRV